MTDAIWPEADARELVRQALAEDVGAGDVTTLALAPESARVTARIAARGAGVMCGAPAAQAVFAQLNPALSVTARLPEGARYDGPTELLRLEGPARAILTGERTALNFLQRLIGIATLTRRYVDAVRGTGTLILDTRKTTPGWRRLEKYAVVRGGGTNHRMGLFDRALIKDNHRRFWQDGGRRSLADAVRAARAFRPGLEVEIEVESLAELEDALAGAPDWILLDNMTLELLRRCVERVGGACRTEASGGITLENIAAVAATGVTAISVGALTHSAPAADLTLEFD